MYKVVSILFKEVILNTISHGDFLNQHRGNLFKNMRKRQVYKAEKGRGLWLAGVCGMYSYIKSSFNIPMPLVQINTPFQRV